MHVRTVQKQRFFSFVFSIRRQQPFLDYGGNSAVAFVFSGRGLLFVFFFFFSCCSSYFLFILFTKVSRTPLLSCNSLAEQRRLSTPFMATFFDNQRRRNHHHDGIFRLVNLVAETIRFNSPIFVIVNVFVVNVFTYTNTLPVSVFKI